MKRIFASFGWLMLLLPLISVAGVNTVFKSINNKVSSTEERPVSGFSAIASGGAFDVFVKFDSKESLRLEGDQDELNKVETVVENGTLRIRYKKDVKLSWTGSTNKINVYISAKTLNGLTVSGSGTMKVEGTVKADKLQTKVSGSGNILLKANTEGLTSVISGSGSIDISGTAKTAGIIVSGSGNFKGKDLHAETADIKVSGSGNAKIYADNSIQAVLSGSGNIGYAGNARVSKTKSGSGSISKF